MRPAIGTVLNRVFPLLYECDDKAIDRKADSEANFYVARKFCLKVALQEPLKVKTKLYIHVVLHTNKTHHFTWWLQAKVRETYGTSAGQREGTAVS